MIASGNNAGLGPVRASLVESACSAGVRGSIPGSGRSPEAGNSYRLQYSSLSLENPIAEEPRRLQSVGLKRVRQDLSNLAFGWSELWGRDRSYLLSARYLLSDYSFFV